MSGAPSKDADDYDASFEATTLRQARRGLSMTHAERLRCLSQTQQDLARLLGRARPGRQHDPER